MHLQRWIALAHRGGVASCERGQCGAALLLEATQITLQCLWCLGEPLVRLLQAMPLACRRAGPVDQAIRRRRVRRIVLGHVPLLQRAGINRLEKATVTRRIGTEGRIDPARGVQRAQRHRIATGGGNALTPLLRSTAVADAVISGTARGIYLEHRAPAARLGETGGIGHAEAARRRDCHGMLILPDAQAPVAGLLRHYPDTGSRPRRRHGVTAFIAPLARAFHVQQQGLTELHGAQRRDGALVQAMLKALLALRRCSRAPAQCVQHALQCVLFDDARRAVHVLPADQQPGGLGQAGQRGRGVHAATRRTSSAAGASSWPCPTSPSCSTVSP